MVAHDRPEGHAAAAEQVDPARAVTGAAGALLLVELGAGAGDLGARLDLVRAGAALGQLPEHDTVEDVGAHLDAEHGVGELERAQLLGREISDLDLHGLRPALFDDDGLEGLAAVHDGGRERRLLRQGALHRVETRTDSRRAGRARRP